MQGVGFIFYILFAAVLVITYLAIRREWASPGMVAGAGMVGSIVAMTLVSLTQNNSIFQALVVGILVGGIFSGATLAVAWYFHSNELREQYVKEHGYPQNNDAYDERGEDEEEYYE